MIKKIIVFWLICTMCLSSMSVTLNAQTASSWTEYFSTGLSNWTSYGYSAVPSTLEGSNYTSLLNSGYKVQNGMLVSGYNFDKDNTGAGNESYIFHDSAFQSGNFSFDVFLADWVNIPQYFGVFPMISEQYNNNSYNFLNKTDGMLFTDSIELEFEGAFGFHQISLWDGYSDAGTYEVSGSQYNAFHHFVVSVSVTEGMNITMDGKLIISTLSTPAFQSQKFGITNAFGVSMFDNISVEGMPATTTTSQATPGYEFIVVLPAMITITLILDKINKKKN